MSLASAAIGIESKYSKEHAPRLTPWALGLVGLLSGILLTDGLDLRCADYSDFLQIFKYYALYWFALLATFVALCLSQVARKGRCWLLCWILLWHIGGACIAVERSPNLGGMDSASVTAIVRPVDLEIPLTGKRSMDVEVLSWQDDDGRVGKLGRKARLNLLEDEQLDVGRLYAIKCLLAKPERLEVPGMFSFSGYMRQKGYGIKIIRKGDAIPLNAKETSIRSILSNHRKHAYEKLQLYSPSGVLPALALGLGSGVDSGTRTEFSQLGISHVLAVSGLHFGLVIAFVAWFLRRILQFWSYGVRRWGVQRLALLGTIPVMFLYIIYVGAPESAQRACIMCLCCILSQLLNRKAHTGRALVIAAWIILLKEPHAIYSLGVQLSFSAVMGCIWSSQYYLVPLHEWMREKIPCKPLCKIAIYLSGALIISMGAGLMTMPILIDNFGTVPVLGLLANLWVIPWVSFLLLPLALCITFIDFAPIVNTLGICAEFLENLMRSLVHIFNTCIPVCHIMMDAYPISIILSAAVSLVLLYKPKFQKKRIIMMFSTVLVWLSCMLFLHFVQPRFQPQGELRMTFISVGQGDATLIEFPNGQVMLVDAGRELRKKYDAGKERVLPYFNSLHIHTIDVLVITHPDYDHYAGLLSVVQNIDVKTVWYNGEHGQDESYQQLYAELEAQNVEWVQVHNEFPIQCFGDTKVNILWPPRNADISFDRNDQSIVLGIQKGNYQALLMGDVSQKVDAQLLLRDISHITLLKAGHHGSRHSTSEALLAATTPSYTLLSLGKNNSYQFPHTQTLERLYAADSKIYRTDRDASIRFSTDGVYLSIESMHASY